MQLMKTLKPFELPDLSGISPQSLVVILVRLHEKKLTIFCFHIDWAIFSQASRVESQHRIRNQDY